VLQADEGQQVLISIPYTMVASAQCQAIAQQGPDAAVVTMHLGELYGTLKTVCEDVSISG
jgi:hypothetical protein